MVGSLRGGTLGLQQVMGGVDQADVGEGLGEIAQLAAGARVVLLGQQAEVVAHRQEALEQRRRVVGPVELDVGIGQPEATGQESGLRAGQAVARFVVGLAAERIADEAIAMRWFESPAQRELVEMAGGVDAARQMIRSTPSAQIQERLPRLELNLDPDELELVRLMMEGRTDAEIATAVGCEEGEVHARLEKVFARMGAPSRSVATLYAFMAGII